MFAITKVNVFVTMDDSDTQKTANDYTFTTTAKKKLLLQYFITSKPTL